MAREHSAQKIAGMVFCIDQGILREFLKSQGDELWKAQVLADHPAEICRREFAQRGAMKPVAFGDKVGVEARCPPVLTVQLLQGFAGVRKLEFHEGSKVA